MKSMVVVHILMVSMLGKNSADNIMKYFSYFSQKALIYYAGNIKAYFFEKSKEKKIINLPSAEFTQRVVKVYPCHAE